MLTVHKHKHTSTQIEQYSQNAFSHRQSHTMHLINIQLVDRDRLLQYRLSNFLVILFAREAILCGKKHIFGFSIVTACHPYETPCIKRHKHCPKGVPLMSLTVGCEIYTFIYFFSLWLCAYESQLSWENV